VFKRFHVLYANDGTALYLAELSNHKSRYCRIFEDINQRCFILDDSGILYHLDKDSYAPIDSVRIDLQEYTVNYSGFGLAVPRTGTKLSNKMDVVFPSHDGIYYVYFQLDIEDIYPLEP